MNNPNPNPGHSPGSTIIDVGGRHLGVLFPHGVLPEPDLANVLSLIRGFVEAWNAATPVSSFIRPGSLGYEGEGSDCSYSTSSRLYHVSWRSCSTIHPANHTDLKTLAPPIIHRKVICDSMCRSTCTLPMGGVRIQSQPLITSMCIQKTVISRMDMIRS